MSDSESVEKQSPFVIETSSTRKIKKKKMPKRSPTVSNNVSGGADNVKNTSKTEDVARDWQKIGCYVVCLVIVLLILYYASKSFTKNQEEVVAKERLSAREKNKKKSRLKAKKPKADSFDMREEVQKLRDRQEDLQS
jgi:type VI protein secretion system component VasK